ncbi:MAG TPA: hypothetical protein VFB50_10505 [Chloroflexota bacterium]|nr:hypothetical protein [Chloroflexota bacterium]
MQATQQDRLPDRLVVASFSLPRSLRDRVRGLARDEQRSVSRQYVHLILEGLRARATPQSYIEDDDEDERDAPEDPLPW